MINELEDLLTINTDANKADQNKKLLLKVKQLLKKSNKAEVVQEKEAVDMPYEAVSVVGNKFITLKFDLKSKKGTVVEIQEDTRDTGGKNYMATYHANNALKQLGKVQMEEENE